MNKASIQQTTGLQVFYNENENVNVFRCFFIVPKKGP